MRMLGAMLLLAGLAAAVPAEAQVGVQFGGGSQRGGLLFGPGRGKGQWMIERPQAPDMKACEQEYGQRAIDACTIVLGRDRNNAKAHRLLADAYLATGRPGIALAEYNEALRIDPDMDEAKRGREMAQRYLAGAQPPAAAGPYAAQPVPAPAPAAPPAAVAAAGPQDGEWSGRMLRQCTGFSDEGASSVMVAGGQFAGVFFSGGGGRDLRGTIAPDGTVEASGRDTAGNLVQVKGRLLSAQTLIAEGYASNCRMVLALGKDGAPVALPGATAAPAQPVAVATAANPFDGEWSGTLTGRAGHFPVTAKVADGKLAIQQERLGSRIVAKGEVDAGGQAAISGIAGDASTRGDNMEIKGAFSGNLFIGQGRVGDKWAEMKLTRTAPAGAPQRPPVAVAQAAPAANAPTGAAPASAPPTPAPAPAAAAAPAASEPAKPTPASETKAAAAAAKAPAQAAAATVAPAPAPMLDKQPPAITVPAKLETDGPVVELSGKIADASAIIEFSVNGQPVPIGPGGAFSVRRGVPIGASELKLAAVDEWGNMSQKTVAVTRRAPQPAAQTAAAPATEETKNRPVQVASIADQLRAIEFGTYRALVIGNNKYAKIRSLETAHNDAQVVGRLLREQYGFQVTVLLDATRQQIMEALYKMRAELTEKDNLLVYYAGHGVRDDATGRGYWLPVDADPDIPTNWVPTTDLTDVIKAMRARHIMVVADSCYSGTLVRNASAGLRSAREADLGAWVRRILQKRSRTVMSSGGLEPVMDGGGGGHSVFAKAFIDALRENPDVIDGQGLFASIRRPIVLNSDQTPEYSDIRQAGHDGGDFLFVKRMTP
jgi:hypothetical protein